MNSRQDIKRNIADAVFGSDTMTFAEELSYDNIDIEQRQATKSSEKQKGELKGIRDNLSFLTESLEKNGQSAAALSNSFPVFLSNSQLRGVLQESLTHSLATDLSKLKSKRANASLSDSMKLDEIIGSFQETYDMANDTLSNTMDNLMESWNMGSFAPFMQLSLPFQVVNTIKNQGKYLMEHQVVKAPEFPVARKTTMVKIADKEYSLYEVTKDIDLLEKMRNDIAPDLAVVAKLNQDVGGVTVGTSTKISLFDGTAYTSAKYTTVALVKITEVTYDDGTVKSYIPPTGMDNTMNPQKGKVGSLTFNIGSDVVTVTGVTDFDNSEVTVMTTDTRVKSIKLETTLSLEGRQNGGIETFVKQEDTVVAIDKMLSFILPVDSITQSGMMSLNNIDITMEATTAMKDLTAHAKDASIFKELKDTKSRIKAQQAAVGITTGRIDEWSGLYEVSADLTPSGNYAQTAVDYRSTVIPEAMRLVGSDFDIHFNSDTKVDAVLTAHPKVTSLIPKNDTIISKNTTFGGVKVDYSVYSVALSDGQKMKVVSSERMAIEDGITVVPRTNDPKMKTFVFSTWKEEMRNDIRDVKNPLLPAVSYISTYGIHSMRDVIGSITLKNLDLSSI